jgi:sugar/nucleoside kinase (ribokinase family)
MLYGDASAEAALTRLQALGCRNAVLKAGAHDVHVLHDGAPTRLPVAPVEQPVDLMGAGDALAAGCLAGLLEGRDLVDAARLGIAVARLAIQLPGNIEAMPTRAEVDRALGGLPSWKR